MSRHRSCRSCRRHRRRVPAAVDWSAGSSDTLIRDEPAPDSSRLTGRCCRNRLDLQPEIEDRIATFETEPRSAEQIDAQLRDKWGRFPTVVYRRHGKLDGEWRDCVVVERLLGEAARV